MVVGKTENTIRFSENVFEDNFLNNTLVFGDTQSNINNFIMQNTIQSEQQFILLDTGKKFAKRKDIPANIVKVDLNDDIYFDPFRFAVNEFEVKFLASMILSSYRFSTKRKDTTNLHNGLIFFMNAVIGFVSTYFKSELCAEAVYKLAKTWKEVQTSNSTNNVLDRMFSEKIKLTPTLMTYPLRNYFEFKLLPVGIQKEAADECIAILNELNNRKCLKLRDDKMIDIDNIIDSGQSLILVPNDDSYDMRFKVEDYILAKILNARKALEISKTKFAPIFTLSENTGGTQYNCDMESINKIHVIIDGFDKVYHSQVFRKAIGLIFNTVSITIINESPTSLNDKNMLDFLSNLFVYKNIILFSSKNTLINKYITNKDDFVPEIPEINEGEMAIIKYSDIDQPTRADVIIDNIYLSQDVGLDYSISLYHTTNGTKTRRNADPSKWKF